MFSHLALKITQQRQQEVNLTGEKKLHNADTDVNRKTEANPDPYGFIYYVTPSSQNTCIINHCYKININSQCREGKKPVNHIKFSDSKISNHTHKRYCLQINHQLTHIMYKYIKCYLKRNVKKCHLKQKNVRRQSFKLKEDHSRRRQREEKAPVTWDSAASDCPQSHFLSVISYLFSSSFLNIAYMAVHTLT